MIIIIFYNNLVVSNKKLFLQISFYLHSLNELPQLHKRDYDEGLAKQFQVILYINFLIFIFTLI